MDKNSKTDFIKFLGTAGARFVMIRQLRASGGLWVSSEGTNILIDPGPGSLVRCAASKPKLSPEKLDAIILTHRHLDHSNDINVMIEAMSEGGFKKKGVVFCPQDALGEDGVIFKYLRGFVQRFEILKAKHSYRAGNFEFKTSMQLRHGSETYGLKFKIKNNTIALLTDTKYFSKIKEFYRSADLLIISVVFLQPRPGIDHLSLLDAEKIIRQMRPKKAILTHFGMTMLAAKPHLEAEVLTKRLGIEVVAAYDGMRLNF